MKKRIVCYGDSNTWGYIAGSGLRYDENIRWPARLRKALGDAYEVEEEGLSGRTTVYDDPISPYKNGYTYLAPCLLTNSPIDLLIIMLGTNDFQSHIPGNNPIVTARGVQFLVEQARALGCNRPDEEMKILIVSPIEITEDRLDFKPLDVTDEKSILSSRELGRHMKIAAEQSGCEFIDAALYIKPSPVDGVHLDEEGHAKLADIVTAKVREMFA